jgi:hypothetical protein
MTYPTAQFQTTVNINNALGVVGELAFDGPRRATPYNLVSTPVANVIGNAFTIVSGDNPDTTLGSTNAGTATAGGTGAFAGILVSPKEYASLGGATGPLSPTITLNDNTIGQLLSMGEVFVYLPGPAKTGDLVTYDPLTGNLNSITPTAIFTGSIAAGGSAGVNDVLTVSAVTAGQLAVGQLISGSGIAGGTYISSLGTGVGNTGTYKLSSINEQTVSSRAMTAPNAPATAFSASAAYITTSAGVDTLHIVTLTSGELQVGQEVFGTGVAANTTITALGTGVGGTGTYTLNTSGQTVASSGSPIAMTGPANLFVPNALVSRFDVASSPTGSIACIRLTN